MAYLGQLQLFNTNASGDLIVAQPTIGETQLQFVYNLLPELVSVFSASSGTVISAPPFAALSTGVSPTGSASFQSKARLHYRAGEGAVALFTALFTSGVPGNSQYAGLGSNQNGFFFGYNGSSFGILYRQATYGASVTQVIVTDTWIPQTSWNKDPLDGTGPSTIVLDPTKGNVYRIQLQWLGFGMINFFVGNPLNGMFTFVHQIPYANVNTNTSLSNPAVPLLAFISNSTNTSNMVLKVPAMGMYVEGMIFENDIIYSISNSSSQNPVSLSNLLAITNVNTFNNIRNGKVVRLSSIAISVTRGAGSARPTLFSLVKNPTNAFSFANLSSGNSCVQYDNTSTFTLIGGNVLLTYYLSDNGEVTIDLSSYNIYINPGDILSIGVQRLINNGSRTCSANLSWFERY